MTRLALRPPAFELGAELSWLLARAFGPLARPAPTAIDGTRIYALAHALGLSPRIGARHDHGLLAREVGETAADAFRHAFLSAAARDAAHLHTARNIDRVARDIGVPAIFLKYCGLRVGGYTTAGGRDACDIDVLTPRGFAIRLERALLASGYQHTGMRGYEHQLPPLVDEDGSMVELHVHVPGVRLPGSKTFATAEELIAAGQVTSTPEWHTPSAPVLAAHALAHALLQNAATPSSHAPLRMLGDLIDIVARAPAALAEAAPLVCRDMDEDDMASVSELLDALTHADLEPSGRATRLLQHLLASQLDEPYARRLRLGLLTRPFGEGSAISRYAASLAHALIPPRTELDVIYGSSGGGAKLLFRRLFRPLDLAGRTVRAVSYHLRRPR
jgi:hypothetical protein